ACKIKFQLSAYMNSDRMMVPYLTDWKQIVTLLRNDPEFYYRFTSKSASSESWSQIEAAVNSIPNEFDKAKYIYDFVQENINWDEKYGLYPDKNPDKCFQLKKGNSASINAAAINLMKRAKLKVYPVVSNPSSEGGINKYYPDLENFGHVFGLVNIDNKNIFFDASYSKLPFGILGEENSIDEGLLISDDNHSWVEIPKRNFTSTIMIDASLDEENNVTGNIKLKQNNYAFAEDYSAYKEDKEGIFWTKRLSKGETNATCEKFVIENIDYSKKELKASFDFNLEHEFIESDDKIYLPINFYGKFEENPFKETTRNTPINFKSTFSENYILNLRLPEGYKITNVPKNIYLQTCKKEITLMLSFTVNPTSVLVNRKININQDFFFENMYNEIKLIFEEINNRSDEMLILEKN
nr:hypothetical protein [Saprospiraceae bacterium]